MKIADAKKAYSAYMDQLRSQQRTLTKLLEEGEKSGVGTHSFDRVEISRELSSVNAQYDAVQRVMENITATETAIHNSEAARQQTEALSEAAEDFAKIMEIFRRISSGGKVPHKDEQMLMEYSMELYQAAKTAALLKQDEGEKYDSLFEDEEESSGETKAPSEIAGETDIAVSPPEVVAAEAAASASEPE